MSSTNPDKHRHHPDELLKERAAELKAINEQLQTEIAERKQAEDALRESEERFRAIFAQAADSIWLVDATTGTLVEFNDRAHENLGYTRDEFQKLKIPEFEVIESAEDVAKHIQKIVKQGTDTFETKHRTKGGEIRDILVSCRAISVGGRDFIQNICRDITEHKRAEEMLKQSERRFRTVVENSPDFIVLVNRDGTIFDVNRLEKGYTREMVIGQSIFSENWFETKDQAAAARDEIEHVFQTCKMGKFEYAQAAPNGSLSFYETRVAPFEHNAEGSVISVQCATRDITERKRAEEEIKASLKEKELLLKEIHHRVKNNLQVVSSLLYLQSEHIKDEQSLATIKENQNRIKSMALVHEQLYQSEGLARVDCAEYIRSLATHLLRSYGVNPDAITLKINADDVLLGIDTALPCGLIINELVSNSLEHAFPAGKARSDRESEIRINLHADDDKLTLTVSDNGVGLPRDLDFRNAESFGLHLVNTLTRQLEGTIELDRSGGTAFEITFAEPQH